MGKTVVVALLLVLGCGAFAIGCGYPAYTSSMRSNYDPETRTKLDCFRMKDKKAKDVTAHLEELARDGWKLAYLSEYTSSAKGKYVYMYCFEKAID